MSKIHTYIALEQFSILVEGHGKVMDGDDAVERAYNAILSSIRGIALGGDARVILNCRGVNLITPGLLLAITTRLENEETPNRTFCYHRSLIVMDPDEDTRLLLKWMLKGTLCSLLLTNTDSQEQEKVIREDILNLPYSLRETLDVIREHGSLSSHQVIALSKSVKPTNIRERLRQLFKRGLVTREARGTVQGDRFFIYQPFSL